MRHSTIKRSWWLVLLCLLILRVASAQTPSALNEQYRQVSRLMAERNYEEAVAESKALIERSPNYHNAYSALAEASTEAGQSDAAGAWLESLLALVFPPRLTAGFEEARQRWPWFRLCWCSGPGH